MINYIAIEFEDSHIKGVPKIGRRIRTRTVTNIEH
jgi:hypothetical protein